MSSLTIPSYAYSSPVDDSDPRGDTISISSKNVAPSTSRTTDSPKRCAGAAVDAARAVTAADESAARVGPSLALRSGLVSRSGLTLNQGSAVDPGTVCSSAPPIDPGPVC